MPSHRRNENQNLAFKWSAFIYTREFSAYAASGWFMVLLKKTYFMFIVSHGVSLCLMVFHGASWCFMGASWVSSVPHGCLMGVSWVSHGCFMGLSWVLFPLAFPTQHIRHLSRRNPTSRIRLFAQLGGAIEREEARTHGVLHQPSVGPLCLDPPFPVDHT